MHALPLPKSAAEARAPRSEPTSAWLHCCLDLGVTGTYVFNAGQCPRTRRIVLYDAEDPLLANWTRFLNHSVAHANLRVEHVAEESAEAGGAAAADDQRAERSDDEEEEEVAPAAKKKKRKRAYRAKNRANSVVRARAKRRGDYADSTPETQGEQTARY